MSDLIGVFRFIDEGKQIDTSQLENPEAKSLLIKIFGALGVPCQGSGKFGGVKRISSKSLGFYKIMKYMKKERFDKLSEFLEGNYPLEKVKEGRKNYEIEDHDDFGENNNLEEEVDQKKSEKKTENKSTAILNSGIALEIIFFI